MPKRATSPSISVIIPTRNRAVLLGAALDSLTHQTLRRGQFEVVVVDDGSNDDTAEVCRRAARRMDLQHVRIDGAGISAAKNLGVFLSSAPLLFFFDDDDLARADLLEQHLETHRAHPEEHVAVLGYTTWAPGLTVTPVMHYVTDVGMFLFSYTRFQHGEWLDYRHFWGGRSSCKRTLLAEHGVFNQTFTFGSEDIELAHRLTRFNLQVIHNREAVQYMNRPVTFDEFCARCERQGRSQWVFSRLHDDRSVQDFCEVIGVDDRWAAVEPRLAGAIERVHAIEATLAERPGQDGLLEELHGLYRLTFNGFRTKGIIEARASERAAGPKGPALPVSIIMPAYNAAGTILSSIDSVQRQTSSDWELIVVDDGSSDDTAKLVRGARRKDKRIRYVRQVNGGVCSARNRGRALASFDWILHLDADDWIEPEYLERMTGVLSADPSLDAVHCAWIRVMPDGRRVGEHFHEGVGDLFQAFTRYCAFAVHACVVRRSIVDAVGGWDTSLRTCEDHDLWMRIARTGANFGALRATLALYRMRQSSASQDGRQYVADGVRVISRAHAADPRVVAHPRHAAGAPAGELPNALFDFVSWPAGLVLGSGGDARPLLDELPVADDPTLDPGSVATCILKAALLPRALPPHAWPDLWSTIEPRLDEFLIALEHRSRARGLAFRVRRIMLDHIVRGMAPENADVATVLGGYLQVGQVGRLMNLEVTEPLPTIDFSAEGCLVMASVKVEGKQLGLLYLPVAGECGPWLFADAIAADFAWSILEAFFARTVYRQLQTTDPGRAVMRGDLCLVDCLYDGDVAMQIHSRAGWTVFLQELWGRPTWPMYAFYDEHTPEGDALLRHVGAERVVIDIGDELPDLVIEGGRTTLDVRVGGSSLGWLPLEQDGPKVRAQQLRARLTTMIGRELCHVVVREALLGAPLADGTLRTRLAAARARHVAPAPTDIVIARRRAGAPGTSASRRAVFPASAAQDLVDAAIARGDGVLRPSSPASGAAARVVYAPDVIREESVRLGQAAPAKTAPRSRVARSLPILMYHRVADGVRGSAARYCVSPTVFESHLRALRDHGAYCITLDEWRVACETRNPIEGSPILLTFDDAYVDFGQQAWPLLKRYGFSAHLFVVTGEVGRYNAWDSPPGEAVPLLGWDQLRGLRDEGVQIGSHTVTHADLTSLAQSDVIREATRSQVAIVRELGQTPLSFAYPYGAMDAFVAHAIASCGYLYGFSCREGQAGHKDPLIDLPRIEVLGTDTADQLRHKIGL